jgi:hypothetical protein
MWQPGESGNPAGRPIGARGRFSQRFVADLTNACGRKLFARSAFSRRVANYVVNRQNCIKMGKTWLLGAQMSGPKPKRAPSSRSAWRAQLSVRRRISRNGG